jgi:hypothetical protein
MADRPAPDRKADAVFLRETARQIRELARGYPNDVVSPRLLEIALELDHRADELD